jgi:hypothetical protein
MGMWYEPNDLLSKNRIYNYIIGNRGGGKTFAYQKWCIKDFIKTGKKFIWLRRYNSEVDEIKTKWASNDLKMQLEPNIITYKGKYIYVNDMQAGIIMALSTAPRVKSVAYDEYNKIIYDEFLIDSENSTLRYMKKEGFAFDELYETVDRLRDETRAIFIGNSISVVNPHFAYNNIKPNLDKEFTIYDDCVIQLYKNEEYIKAKLKTRFGRKNANTDYGAYSINNKFIRDNYSFICERPNTNLIYSLTIMYNNTKYGVWLKLDKNKDSLFIDNFIEEKCERAITITMEDLNEQYKFKKFDGLKAHIMQLKYMFNEGKVYFNSIQTKKDFFEIIKVL